jgi:PucR family transcriptional regulator, purine catabolism regulatory protein
MAITVRRLAQNTDLGLFLAAGRENADRTITWAHAIELADPTPYLSGGELVMTTGMNVGATDAEQFHYVARLSAAGIAALAFDTGTTFDRLPDGIVSAGNALGMPILRVPASTPFIAISRAVIDELNADQLRSLQRIVDLQEVLARATLRGGIPAVVSALSQTLSATVVVLGSDFCPLAASGPRQQDVTRVSTERLHTTRSRTVRHASAVFADDDGYYTLQALRVAEAIRGYLAVGTPEPLSTTDRLLVAHVVSLISIELEKPAKVADAEQRLRTVVSKALMAEPHSSDPGVLRYFGFDPDGDVVAVVLTDIGPAMTAERHAHRILADGPASYLMSSTDNELVIILPAAHAAEGRELHRKLGAQLQRRLGGGLSLPAPLRGIGTALNQARAAARVYGEMFCEFGQLGTFAVILGGRSVGELQILTQSLKPLEAHDASQAPADDTLVATLESFLSHNGQVEIAAKELNIHRHTMRNRLAKITALTGRDMQSADVRAEMWVALKARELLAIVAKPWDTS